MRMELSAEDFLNYLGWDIPSSETSYYTCPFCGDGKDIGRQGRGGKKKLNISMKKGGMWRCNSCQESGNMLTMVAKINGVSNKEAIKMVYKNVSSSTPVAKTSKKQEKEQTVQEELDEQKCNNVYTKLLHFSSLSDRHREDLLRRGFTEADIERLGYKSSREYKMNEIANLIQKMGLTKENGLGVPMTFINKVGEIWLSLYLDGIIVPFRDIHGKIIRLDIRNNEENVNDENPKYIHVTSAEKDHGTTFTSAVHFATDFKDGEAVLGKNVYLTEGVIKSDLFHAKTHAPCIALPGVNNLAPLKETLEVMKEKGVENIRIAFDMDRVKNEQVSIALQEVAEIIKEAGLTYTFLQWETEYINYEGERVKFSPKDTFFIPWDRKFGKKRNVVTMFEKLKKLEIKRVIFSFETLQQIAETKAKYQYFQQQCEENGMDFELGLFRLKHKGIDDYVVDAASRPE